MEKLIELISKNQTLEYIGGCSTKDLENAELKLELKFPKEYKNLLLEFGVISFNSHEWFGLNVTGYLNVIESTLSERKLNNKFPSDCFVLENLGIDGVLILVDSNENVYEWNGYENKVIATSLSQYYLDCLK